MNEIYIDTITGEELVKQTRKYMGDFFPIEIYYNNLEEKKSHRIDGPAHIYVDGTNAYYKNGNLHRLDGPAVNLKNGIKKWWVDGKKYTESEFNIIVRKMKMENL